MSDSMYFPEEGSRERGIKRLWNTVVFGSGAITSSTGTGTAVTRTAAGTYTLTTDDPFVEFKGIDVIFNVNGATPVDLIPQVYDVSISGKTIKFKLLAAALTGSATWDPANLVDGAGESKDITVTGAALGDYAMGSLGVDTQGMILSAVVKAANTVTLRLQNETGGALDLASSTARARVVPSGGPVATDPASGTIAYIEVKFKDSSV